MKIIIIALLLTITHISQADTLAKYVEIAKSIPAAKLKADPAAQAWARSARSILEVTEETIAQTIQAAQQLAEKKSHPLFCLNNNKKIDSGLVQQILEPKVQHLPASEAQQTISEVDINDLVNAFPCNKKQTVALKSMIVPDSNAIQMQRVSRN